MNWQNLKDRVDQENSIKNLKANLKLIKEQQKLTDQWRDKYYAADEYDEDIEQLEQAYYFADKVDDWVHLLESRINSIRNQRKPKRKAS